jgi:hypothetical protein
MENKIQLQSILKGLFIILALATNYIAGFVLTYILNLEIGYALLIVAISSFLAGMIAKNTGKSLAYACLSLVLSVGVTLILLSAPSFIAYGVILIGPSMETLLPPIIFVIFASFFGALVGSLVGDYFFA